MYKKDFGSTGNVPVFDNNGFIVDSTHNINAIISGSTGSTITASNGLTKIGTTLQLGGTLQKYATYIYADPNNAPNPNGYPAIIWFGASGQTSTPTGDSLNVVYYPLGGVNFTLSGASAFYDNIPKNSDISFAAGGLDFRTYSAVGSSSSFSQISNEVITVVSTSGSSSTTLDMVASDNSGLVSTTITADASSLTVSNQQVGLNYYETGGTGNGSFIDMESSTLTIGFMKSPQSASIIMLATGTTYNANVGGFAITDNFNNPANAARAIGRGSFAMGRGVQARADYSFAGGKGTTTNKQIFATGATSFNFSENNTTQTAFHGAQAANSFILGGLNHNVPRSASRSGIIGGSAIKVASGITDTVHFPKVRLGLGTGGGLTTTVSGTSFNLMHRNSTTGELQIVTSDFLLYANSYRQAVKMASTTNFSGGTYIATGATYNGSFIPIINFASSISARTIDGITLSTLAVGERVLLKNQTTALQNGIYTLNSSTTLVRAVDFFKTAYKGDIVYVQSGTTNGNTSWALQNANPITIGTTGLIFIPVNLPIVNNGLTNSGIGNRIRLGGILTGSTTIGLTANNLTFTGTTGTLRYGSDLSANYNVRSLIDKGYATGSTLYLAENGLTKIGNNKVKLGGNITGATTIGLAANNFTITASTGTIRYGGDYSANYNVRSLVDKGYATGSTIYLAENGLTKVANNKVKLGGTITGATTIDATTSILTLTGTSGQLNIARTTGSINVSSRNTINLIGKSVAGVDRTTLKLSATGATFTDARTGTTATGLRYAANYSANYNVRSLIDKGYATGSTLYLAENGLTKVNNNKVKLGGIITGDTSIYGDGHNFKVGINDISTQITGVELVVNNDPNNDFFTPYWALQEVFDDGFGSPVPLNGIQWLGGSNVASYIAPPTITGAYDIITKNYADTNYISVNSGAYLKNVNNDIGNNTFNVTGTTFRINTNSTNSVKFEVNKSISDSIRIQSSDASSQNYVRIEVGEANGNGANGRGIDMYTAIGGGVKTRLNISPSSGITVTDANANGGIRYMANYSSNYKTRSLVDKGYVTGNTILTTTNGLSKVGINQVGLGGTLTGATTITLNNNNITFTTTGTTASLKYGGNYSSNFTTRSLIDKGYATGSTLYLAENGLTKVNNNKVKLGGNITGATTIGLAANILTFTASTGTIKYGGNYSSNFTARSLIDKGYATGSTLYLAENGLTKVNNNKVKLGGTVTGDTIVKTTGGAGIFIDATNSASYLFNGDVQNFLDPIATVAVTDPSTIQLLVSDVNTGTNSYSEMITIDTGTIVLASSTSTVEVGNTVNSNVSSSYIQNIDLGSGRKALFSNAAAATGSEITLNVTDNSSKTTYFGITDNASTKGIRVTLPSTGHTFQYTADYSNGYKIRSLVDKGFVTGNTFTKSSATFGHKTLTGGTAVVTTTAIAAGSVVLLTIDGGTQTNAGTVRVSARSAGSNFTITSSNASDTSQVGWVILN